jgi:protein-tyrosine phosphatase
MQHKINKKGLKAEVDSAGFEDYHIGEPADPRSVEIATKNGVSLDGHSARQFEVEDFDRFDRIYVMDETNYRDVTRLARNQDDLDKIDYIMNTVDPDSNTPVPDPYYGGEEGFSNVYRMLDTACEKIAGDIENNKNTQSYPACKKYEQPPGA